jgi:trimethylamine--corrinoid protein Co-methyltransferase
MSRRRNPRSREKLEMGGAASLNRWPFARGYLVTLTKDQKNKIHAGVMHILSETGFEFLPEYFERFLDNKRIKKKNGRFCFGIELVEKCLSSFNRNVSLHQQNQESPLDLSSGNVYCGTGGAAPLIYDHKINSYRPTLKQDLLQAARVADKLENISFFSRPLVLTDISDTHLMDIYTTVISLSATQKHVMTSVENHQSVEAIARTCYLLAGGEENFRKAPFLSMNINFIIPPLKLHEEACLVMRECVRYGIPVMANVFGQRGASSPVSVTGSVCQTIAETLSGLLLCWLMDPSSRVICGPRAMVTDLRTGGMAGGSGEQAQTTSLLNQMMRYYNLPNSSIAGATDSNIPDYQAGYEKALTIATSAHSGANLITQANGMLSGLMGVSLESFVLDNELCGSILSSLRSIDVSTIDNDLKSLEQVIMRDQHFLGEPDTLKRMNTDFYYPKSAKRLSPELWAQNKGNTMLTEASKTLEKLLSTKFKSHISSNTFKVLEKDLNIEIDFIYKSN